MSKIIYKYEINNGGLADFLKFFIHTINVAEDNNFEILIDINHPIKKYIIIKDDYSFKLYTDQPNIKNYIPLNNYTCKNIKDILSTRQNFLFNPTYFYCLNINFNLKNEIDFKNVVNPISNCVKYDLFKYMNFTDDIYMDLDQQMPTKKYICIHARLGDKFLEVKPDEFYSAPNDDRQLFNTNYTQTINSIINSISDPDILIYLFADNNNFKNQMKEKFPILNIFNNQIINISCKYNNDNYDQNLKNTIIEFLFLSRSSEIHVLSYSGFSYIAHYLGSNKIIKCF
jgi:hypothetical protein